MVWHTGWGCLWRCARCCLGLQHSDKFFKFPRGGSLGHWRTTGNRWKTLKFDLCLVFIFLIFSRRRFFIGKFFLAWGYVFRAMIVSHGSLKYDNTEPFFGTATQSACTLHCFSHYFYHYFWQAWLTLTWVLSFFGTFVLSDVSYRE